jgi:hypothetical protein
MRAENNHTLQLGIFHSLDLRGQESEPRAPGLN